jgi:hypothetical protein
MLIHISKFARKTRAAFVAAGLSLLAACKEDQDHQIATCVAEKTGDKGQIRVGSGFVTFEHGYAVTPTSNLDGPYEGYTYIEINVGKDTAYVEKGYRMSERVGKSSQIIHYKLSGGDAAQAAEPVRAQVAAIKNCTLKVMTGVVPAQK